MAPPVALVDVLRGVEVRCRKGELGVEEDPRQVGRCARERWRRRRALPRRPGWWCRRSAGTRPGRYRCPPPPAVAVSNSDRGPVGRDRVEDHRRSASAAGPVEISVVAPPARSYRSWAVSASPATSALGGAEEHARAVGRDGAESHAEVPVAAVRAGGQQRVVRARALVEVHARVGVRGNQRLECSGRDTRAPSADAPRYWLLIAPLPPFGPVETSPVVLWFPHARAHARSAQSAVPASAPGPRPLQFSPKAERGAQAPLLNPKSGKREHRVPAFPVRVAP